MHTTLIFLTFLFLLTACGGGTSSKAKFEISFQGITGTATPTGGLIVYGSNGTDKFTHVISNPIGTLSGSIVEELPQGTWKFGAVGWMGTRAFEGEIRCAFTSVGLTGDAVTVNLNLSNSRCFQSDVAIPGTFNGVAPQSFGIVSTSFCEGSVLTKGSAPCTYSPTVKPTPAGFAGSYEILVAGGRVSSKGTELFPTEILKSNCYRAGTDAEPIAAPTYSTAALNFPAFNPIAGAPFRIRVYLSDDCSAGKGSFIRSMGNPAEVKVASNTPGAFLHVSASLDDVCKESIGSTGPASGTGTPTNPWLICTEDQLLWVQRNFSNTVYNSGSYILGKDLDLIKFIKAGSIGLTPADTCLEDGDTFVPIGAYFTPSPACVYTNIAPTSVFAFDGNGKKISNFRFSSKQTTVGFFDDLNGKVYDLTFDRAEVRGQNYSAIVAGIATGATIDNVRVTNSELEGDNNTGSIVGQAQGMTVLNMIQAIHTKVRGFSITGGLVGSISTGSIDSAYFEGKVTSDGGSSIGGIAGSASVVINKAFSSGLLQGRGGNMGGIAGTSGNLFYAGSDMYIEDTDSSTTGPRFVGGLAGAGGTTISRSFFRGKIKTACTISCSVGSISGNSASTVPYTYAISDEGMALGGQDGDTVSYTYTGMTTGSSFVGDLCNLDGACGWTQVSGDYPRLPFMTDHPCGQAVNNVSIATQISAGRGTATNPILICRRDQLGSVGTATGKTLVQKQNIYGKLVMTGVSLTSKYDGDGHVIFGYETVDDTVSSAFFDQITAGAEFTNVVLAGFKHVETTSCATCNESGLAKINNGLIKKVEMYDVEIKASDASAQVAGMVGVNYGTISESRISGSLKNYSKIGGVAYQNDGTIQDSRSEVKIDLNGSLVGTSVGGIAGINRNRVFRNRFRGEIRNLGGGTNTKFGGIVGYFNNGGISGAGVIDNLVSEDVLLEYLSGTTNSAAIVGYSDNAANIIARNITYGFTFNQSGDATINPVLGSGSFTNIVNGNVNQNFALNTQYSSFDSVSSSLTTVSETPTAGHCTMTFVTTSVDTTPASGAGALSVMNMGYYMGTLTRIATQTYELVVPLKASECANLSGQASGTLNSYVALDIPDLPTISDLRNNYYDVRDFSIPADADIAFAAYKNILLGQPVTSPVWLIEEEEGINLFNNH